MHNLIQYSAQYIVEMFISLARILPAKHTKLHVYSILRKNTLSLVFVSSNRVFCSLRITIHIRIPCIFLWTFTPAGLDIPELRDTEVFSREEVHYTLQYTFCGRLRELAIQILLQIINIVSIEQSRQFSWSTRTPMVSMAITYTSAAYDFQHVAYYPPFNMK